MYHYAVILILLSALQLFVIAVQRAPTIGPVSSIHATSVSAQTSLTLDVRLTTVMGAMQGGMLERLR